MLLKPSSSETTKSRIGVGGGLKSAALMTGGGSLKRRDYDDDDVFAMDVDGGHDDDDELYDSGISYGRYPYDEDETYPQHSSVADDDDESMQPPTYRSGSQPITTEAQPRQPQQLAGSAPATVSTSLPTSVQSRAAGKLPMARTGSHPSPRVGPMAAPSDLPARTKSGPAATGSRRNSEAEADRIKKPRRSNSASAPSTPMLTPAGTPLLGPSAAPLGGTPLLGPVKTGTPLIGPSVVVGTSKSGSKTGSKSGSPKLGPSASPKLGPLGTALMPLEADLQPHAMLRQHEFKSGRRVFHVHFGHGFVRSMDSPETEQPPQPSSSGTTPPEMPAPRPIASTQNINVHFDNPKYKQLRLRAFYAVPKMVVIPSTQALRKAKLHAIITATSPDATSRCSLINSLLASGSVRAACSLVLKWQLQASFPPTQLVEQLLASKCHAAAVRFARDFGLHRERPAQQLLRRMLEQRHYEGALKLVDKRSASVDGERSPADVLDMMVRNGHHAVALKYVHKFGCRERFPPDQLVSRCLQEGDAGREINVRTWGLLLKYVKAFGLEGSFPMADLIERATASGLTVHEMDGKYILKGRRRQTLSGCSQTGSQAGSRAGSQTGSPKLAPGASPVIGATASMPIS